MKLRVWAFLISAVSLVLFFQNCAKTGIKVDDKSANGTVTGQGDQTNGDNGNNNNGNPTDNPPTTVTDLIKSCDDAKARGKIQIKNVQINFEDNKGDCPWSSGDNLSMENDQVRARIEQYQQVALPSGAVVCGMSMVNYEEQNFFYDDNIIMTLNDYVMASTTNYSKHFASTNGYYKYSWANIVGKKAQNLAEDTTPQNQYCAGSSSGLASCLFPQTETNGKVQVQFNERVIQNVLGMTSATSVKLGLITTGDNDPSSDCHHVPIRMNVEVQYF